jgi:hypothetical protein
VAQRTNQILPQRILSSTEEPLDRRADTLDQAAGAFHQGCGDASGQILVEREVLGFVVLPFRVKSIPFLPKVLNPSATFLILTPSCPANPDAINIKKGEVICDPAFFTSVFG